MARSMYGDGSLIQRKDGRWEYRVRVDGKYKSFYSRDKTGRQAKLAYREWLERRDEEKIEKRMTVAKWAQTWLEVYKHGKCSAGTYKNYEVYVRNHIIPHIGDMRMEDVRQVHIERLYAAEQGLSKTGLAHIRICLKGIFETGMRNRLCVEDPSAGIAPPRSIPKTPECFTTEEVARIVSAAPGHPLSVYALGLIYTGCRIGEACGLMWSDYDGSTLTVRRGVSRQDDDDELFSIAGTKTGRERQIVLNEEGRQFFDSLPHEALYIFPGNDGDFMNPGTFRQRYYRYLEAIGVRKLSPHKCRHTYGTMLLAACKNLRTVQDQLGHVEVTTTQIYAHTDLSTRREDVGTLKFKQEC